MFWPHRAPPPPNAPGASDDARAAIPASATSSCATPSGGHWPPPPERRNTRSRDSSAPGSIACGAGRTGGQAPGPKLLHWSSRQPMNAPPSCSTFCFNVLDIWFDHLPPLRAAGLGGVRWRMPCPPTHLRGRPQPGRGRHQLHQLQPVEAGPARQQGRQHCRQGLQRVHAQHRQGEVREEAERRTTWVGGVRVSVGGRRSRRCRCRRQQCWSYACTHLPGHRKLATFCAAACSLLFPSFP